VNIYAKGVATISTQIIDIVSGVLGVTVSEEYRMENATDWGSLKTLQIVMALEEAGYEIPIEKISEIKSVRDILSFVQSGE